MTAFDHLEDPKTAGQLQSAKWRAVFRFKGVLNDLARREGFHPGLGYDVGASSVQQHPNCAAEYKAAHQRLLDEQDELSRRFNAHFDARFLAQLAKGDSPVEESIEERALEALRNWDGPVHPRWGRPPRWAVAREADLTLDEFTKPMHRRLCTAAGFPRRETGL